MGRVYRGASWQGASPATVIGAVAAVVTAGLVSWATPDGNLVVTLVPALAVGEAAFGLALWLARRRRGKE